MTAAAAPVPVSRVAAGCHVPRSGASPSRPAQVVGKRLNARHAWRYNSLDDRDVTGSMRRAAFLAFLVLWSGPSVIGTSAPAIARPVGAAATGGGPVGNETGLPKPRHVTLRPRAAIGRGNH